MATITKRQNYGLKRSRKAPDNLMITLVEALGDNQKYGFNDIFEKTFELLKKRNAVSGGEEMLRLRTYEKLQGLVQKGCVERTGREYKATKRLQEALPAPDPAE